MAGSSAEDLRDPDDDASDAVGEERIGATDAGGGELAGVLEVGGEEEVEGRVVADLGVEVAGGAVGDIELDGGMGGAELGREGGHGEVEIGGRGDGELMAGGVRRAGGEREKERDSGQSDRRGAVGRSCAGGAPLPHGRGSDWGSGLADERCGVWHRSLTVAAPIGLVFGGAHGLAGQALVPPPHGRGSDWARVWRRTGAGGVAPLPHGRGSDWGSRLVGERCGGVVPLPHGRG